MNSSDALKALYEVWGLRKRTLTGDEIRFLREFRQPLENNFDACARIAGLDMSGVSSYNNSAVLICLANHNRESIAKTGKGLGY